MSFLPMALDGLMAVLLAITIGYAAILNRRLATWRNDKAELEKLIDRFNRAAQHADIGISTLKEASEATGRDLSQATAKAQSLRDDLAFLIERAEPIADRMTEQSRPAARPRRPVSPAVTEPYEIFADMPPAKPAPAAAPVPESAAPAAAAAPEMRAAVPAAAKPRIRPYRPGEDSASAKGAAERNLLKALASLRKD